METVFDLATPEELIDLFGEDDPDLPEDLREYKHERQYVLEDADYNFSMLAELYDIRGDKQKADECIAKIQDDDLRMSTVLLLYECMPAASV